MALRAYFDGSGHYRKLEETACVVGGFIAHIEHWDKFEPEWFKVLERYGVTEFKASALTCFDYEFSDWDEPKRRAFLQELVALIKNYLPPPNKPIAALLPSSQFRNLLPERQQEWGGDPHYPCLQTVITVSASHARGLYDPPEAVSIICDEEDDDVQEMAERVYKACRRLLPGGLGDYLSGFGFDISHRVAGLQVADFVAYYALQLRRDMIEGKDNLIDKPWWPMEQLLAMFHPEFEFFVAPQLWEMGPLTNYSL